MSDRDDKGRWQPGQSPNPLGRPRLPADLRAIKKLTPSYIRMVIAKLTRMDPGELMSYLELPLAQGGPNNLEIMVASIIRRAGIDGDQSKLNFLLDRSIGKVVEERKLQLEHVIYKTTVRSDGALMQEVVAEALGEDTKEKEEA